jgi:hypothetical protein
MVYHLPRVFDLHEVRQLDISRRLADSLQRVDLALTMRIDHMRSLILRTGL